MPVVRVMVPVPIDREGEEELWFVNSLLLLRDRAPLHEVDIRTYLDDPSAPLNVELWLRYAASCHVRVLRVWVLPSLQSASAATQRDSHLPAPDSIRFRWYEI